MYGSNTASRRKWLLLGVPLLGILALVASACFVQGGQLFVRGNDSVFVGMARNALDGAKLVDVRVRVKFYDGDTLLGTRTVRICTRTLQSDDGSADAPFEAILRRNTRADNVETEFIVNDLGEKDVPDLEFRNVSIAWIGGNFVITGEVFNDDFKDFEDVTVCAATLDRDDNVLRVAKVNIGDLDDDETGSFEITLTRDSKARDFKLWADAETKDDDVTGVVTRTPARVPDRTATPTATATGTPTPTSTPTTPTATATPTPPTLTSAAVNADTLALTYDRPLDPASVPDPSDFTVTVGEDGADQTPATVVVVGSTVLLTLATPVTEGQRVTLDYTPGTTPIQDRDGTPAEALVDEEVTNDTP